MDGLPKSPFDALSVQRRANSSRRFRPVKPISYLVPIFRQQIFQVLTRLSRYTSGIPVESTSKPHTPRRRSRPQYTGLRNRWVAPNYFAPSFPLNSQGRQHNDEVIGPDEGPRVRFGCLAVPRPIGRHLWKMRRTTPGNTACFVL